MKDSVIHLIRYAKDKGCVISVYDGEAYAVRRSSNEREIIEAINSVEEAQVIIRRADNGDRVAWALIIPDLAADEKVSDCTDNDFMNEWAKQYNLATA